MSHIKMPVAVHLFIIKENKILLSRRYNTGFQDGNYSVVAGHMERNETIKQAMIREAMEEANIILDSEKLEIIQAMHRRTETEERIDYFIFSDEWQGKLKNNEPLKCDDLRWFDLNQLPENMVEYVRYALVCYLRRDYFTEFGY